LVRVRRL